MFDPRNMIFDVPQQENLDVQTTKHVQMFSDMSQISTGYAHWPVGIGCTFEYPRRRNCSTS